jgi:hypothetical protein
MTNEQKQLQKSLAIAAKRRDELVRERMRIEKELVQQNRVIASISEVLGVSPEMDVGITDAALLIVRAGRREGLIPTEIRDNLRIMGYDIDSFSNPMASLHQVLIRLKEKGLIEEIPSSACPDGKKRYVYKHPSTLPPLYGDTKQPIGTRKLRNPPLRSLPRIDDKE